VGDFVRISKHIRDFC